jgi:MFS family permease
VAADGSAGRIARSTVNWSVMGLSVCLGLVSFGYGALTSFSALFTDALHVAPRYLYLTIMAVTILVARLGFGRSLDAFGHRRVLMPCLVAPAIGLLLLGLARGRGILAISAVTFGAGFGLMYPAYAAFVMRHVDARRRGAAFGAILCAFDTGIGTGSTSLGWLAHRLGYRAAFVVAGLIASLALPYFLVVEQRLGFTGVPHDL